MLPFLIIPESLNSLITNLTYSDLKNQAMKLMTSKEYVVLIAKWQLRLCCALALITLTWGCAVAPKTLYVKDLSESFVKDTIISAETGKPISFENLVAELNAGQVIYVGEQHTDRSHHQIQLKYHYTWKLNHKDEYHYFYYFL